MAKLRATIKRFLLLFLAIAGWAFVLYHGEEVVVDTVSHKAEVARVERSLYAGMVGTWELDLRTGRLVWDGPMFAIHGIDPPEDESTMDYAFWEQHLHPADKAHAQYVFDTTVSNRSHFVATWRMIDKDGKVRNIAARGQVSEDGRIFSGVNMLSPQWIPSYFSKTAADAFQMEIENARADLVDVQQMRGK